MDEEGQLIAEIEALETRLRLKKKELFKIQGRCYACGILPIQLKRCPKCSSLCCHGCIRLDYDDPIGVLEVKGCSLCK
jgi:predicted Zn-ribbon and HTH transcriptional regulator